MRVATVFVVLSVLCAVGSALVGACTPAQRAATKADLEEVVQQFDKACAARAAYRDAGPPQVEIVTDGCEPDASNAQVTCTGKRQ